MEKFHLFNKLVIMTVYELVLKDFFKSKSGLWIIILKYRFLNPYWGKVVNEIKLKFVFINMN